ncbi:MAG TPA: hypothetical protein VK660_06170, partial [Xanthomonadaceae bacterium]|nr:hypothetical protein [Xanthomonadaceae bacterium]
MSQTKVFARFASSCLVGAAITSFFASMGCGSALAATAAASAAPALTDRAAFEQDIAKWRRERVEHLRKPD